jgi:hypothetical protein
MAHQQRPVRRILTRFVSVAVSAGVVAVAAMTPAHADSQVRSRGPHDKVPAGSVAYLDGDALVIVIPTHDRGGSAAIYDAVDSPQELLDSFKSQGIVDRAIPTVSIGTDGSAAAGMVVGVDVTPNEAEGLSLAYATPPSQVTGIWECGAGYGGAQYHTGSSCPGALTKLRWADTPGFADPQVYFNDHTPARWPVGAAIGSWNPTGTNDPHIDSYHSGSCPSGRHCVHVWNANYGPDPWGSAGNPWRGYVYLRWNASFNLISGAVAVHFNDYYAADSYRDRVTACHELGHALGLGHHLSELPSGGGTPIISSCLYYVNEGTTPQTPAQSDYQLLRNVVYP